MTSDTCSYKERLAHIDCFLFDVDGVFTDFADTAKAARDN